MLKYKTLRNVGRQSMKLKKLFILTYVFIALFWGTSAVAEASGETETKPITITETPTTLTTKKNGFVTVDGNTYYYKNNKKKKGFQEIEGKTY